MTDDEIDAAFGRGMARTLTALVSTGETQVAVVKQAKKKSKGRTASPSKIVPREQPSWRKAG